MSIGEGVKASHKGHVPLMQLLFGGLYVTELVFETRKKISVEEKDSPTNFHIVLLSKMREEANLFCNCCYCCV
jgi:hypothetical protein